MKAFLLLFFSFWIVLLPVQAQDAEPNLVMGEVFETNPEFPGGLESFYNFIEDNAPSAHEKSGKVFISFFVEPNGSISEPTIVKGLDESTDNALLELMTRMPQWKPATLKGKAVRKKMVLPIDI